VVAWGASVGWEKRIGHANPGAKMGAVFVPMLAATLVYFAAAFALRVPFTQEFVSIIRRRLRI
jgi:hypothetical protein